MAPKSPPEFIKKSVRGIQLRSLDLEARGARKVEAVPEHIIDDVLARVQTLFEQKSAAFCDSILRMNRQLRQRKASALQV